MSDLFKIRSSVTFQSSFFKGLVLLYFRVKSACSFTLHFMLLTHKNAPLSYVATAQSTSPLARAPYVGLFDLKLLIEDGNLLVYMYCVHARKRASEAPRTHFRACKISKFPGACPQTPSHNPCILLGPTFCICLAPPLQSSQWPC